MIPPRRTSRAAVVPARYEAEGRPGGSEAVRIAVHGALVLAIAERARVALVIRGDPASGREMRTVEGMPYEITSSTDGRERVSLRVVEGTEQRVLLDRIVRVMRAAV